MMAFLQIRNSNLVSPNASFAKLSEDMQEAPTIVNLDDDIISPVKQSGIDNYLSKPKILHTKILDETEMIDTSKSKVGSFSSVLSEAKKLGFNSSSSSDKSDLKVDKDAKVTSI
ncbi:GSCOCG00012068001-RA-CDS [Cotesia congregata]|nr:GSCOCG00012068001-RA-CDS [Cotesia congregata]